MEENPSNEIDPYGLYRAIAVILPDGTVYIPLTVVKNQQQADAYKLPIGTPTAIAVPDGENPQARVDCWADAKDKSYESFKAYWSDPTHNFKVVNGAMYDAYGNFEYGATGEAAGFSLPILQLAAEYLHGWNNNPINSMDIRSGFDAIQAGGKLGIIDY